MKLQKVVSPITRVMFKSAEEVQKAPIEAVQKICKRR